MSDKTVEYSNDKNVTFACQGTVFPISMQIVERHGDYYERQNEKVAK